MNDYGRLQTLIICLDQLLTSKIHKKINLRNKIAIFFCSHHDLMQNLFTDRLWAPRLYSQEGLERPGATNANLLKLGPHGKLNSSTRVSNHTAPCMRAMDGAYYNDYYL